MDMETFAKRVEALRPKLYRIAFCYLGSEAAAAGLFRYVADPHFA